MVCIRKILTLYKQKYVLVQYIPCVSLWANKGVGETEKEGNDDAVAPDCLVPFFSSDQMTLVRLE